MRRSDPDGVFALIAATLFRAPGGARRLLVASDGHRPVRLSPEDCRNALYGQRRDEGLRTAIWRQAVMEAQQEPPGGDAEGRLLGRVAKVAEDAGCRSKAADGRGQVGSVGGPADHRAVIVELPHEPFAVVHHEAQLVERKNHIEPERFVVVLAGCLDDYESIEGERGGAGVSGKSANVLDRPSGGES